MNMFVLLEDIVDYDLLDDCEEAVANFAIRGISTSLTGAMSLASAVIAHGMDEDALQIEEVPIEIPLATSLPSAEDFGIAGAIAMYDVDGTLVRRVL